MRRIEILVRDKHRDATFDTLDDVGVDFVSLDADRRDASLVTFPVPSGAVEEILEELRDAEVEVERYTVVSDLNTAMTPNVDELEKEYTEGDESDSRIARNELRTSAREIEPDRNIFLAQAVLSATVATAGLLLNSAIAIVGSMVISPLTSSLLSVAFGAFAVLLLNVGCINVTSYVTFRLLGYRPPDAEGEQGGWAFEHSESLLQSSAPPLTTASSEKSRQTIRAAGIGVATRRFSTET